MTITCLTIIKLVPPFIVAFIGLMDFIHKVHQDKKITATSANVTVIVHITVIKL